MYTAPHSRCLAARVKGEPGAAVGEGETEDGGGGYATTTNAGGTAVKVCHCEVSILESEPAAMEVSLEHQRTTHTCTETRRNTEC